jgi:hypothetical protein
LGTIAGGTMLAGEQARMANQQIFMTVVRRRGETSRILLSPRSASSNTFVVTLVGDTLICRSGSKKMRSDIQTNLAEKPPATTFAASVC